MKTRHLLMSACLIGAAGLAFFGDSSGDSGMVQPVARLSAMPLPDSAAAAVPAGKRVIGSSTVIETGSQISRRVDEDRILALQPRADMVGAVKGGDSLFSSKSWTPPPSIARPALLPASPPPPPAAPPLPFTYLGKQTIGGKTEVFLANGDKVVIAREQDVIQNTYRVESIRPTTLSMVYLPLNEIQRLSIGVTN